MPTKAPASAAAPAFRVWQRLERVEATGGYSLAGELIESGDRGESRHVGCHRHRPGVAGEPTGHFLDGVVPHRYQEKITLGQGLIPAQGGAVGAEL